MAKEVKRISEDGTVKVYPSMTRAAAEHGVSIQSLSFAVNYGYNCAGYHWECDGVEVHRRVRPESKPKPPEPPKPLPLEAGHIMTFRNLFAQWMIRNGIDWSTDDVLSLWDYMEKSNGNTGESDWKGVYRGLCQGWDGGGGVD